MVLVDLFVFVLAFIVLAKAAQVVIDNAIKISEYLGFSQLAIGFILIGVAVSLPDLLVSVIASVQGKVELAVGDALGSSIANICLVLGIATMIRRINVERKHTLDSAELMLVISVLPLLMLSRILVGQFEGFILIFAFIVYTFFVFKTHMSLKIKDGITRRDYIRLVGFFFLGLVGTVISAQFVVDKAIVLARFAGLSEAIIGMTIISFGTTLPELVIDFTAIRRGQIALAIGDILGSTVTNLTLVLGLALALSPTVVDFSVYSLSIAFIVIANSFLVYNLFKRGSIGPKTGVVFLLMYVVFILATIATSGFYFPNRLV